MTTSTIDSIRGSDPLTQRNVTVHLHALTDTIVHITILHDDGVVFISSFDVEDDFLWASEHFEKEEMEAAQLRLGEKYIPMAPILEKMVYCFDGMMFTTYAAVSDAVEDVLMFITDQLK